METIPTQQEILLLTGTSFASREFCDAIDGLNSNLLNQKEKLVVACWNGLLPVILPEVFEKNRVNNKFFLWEVREASSFIELEMGETHLAIEREFSIDPYMFFSTQNLS